jgi:hypothetical protein
MAQSLSRHTVDPSAPTPSWRDQVAIHPAADLLPLMATEESRELAENIAKYGLRTSPAIFAGEDGKPTVYDGRNRLTALEYLGYSFFVVQRYRNGHCAEWAGVGPVCLADR